MNHDRGVFSDRVKHHRILKFGGNFPNDMDALGFELFEMRKLVSGQWKTLFDRNMAFLNCESRPKDGPMIVIVGIKQ